MVLVPGLLGIQATIYSTRTLINSSHSIRNSSVMANLQLAILVACVVFFNRPGKYSSFFSVDFVIRRAESAERHPLRLKGS